MPRVGSTTTRMYGTPHQQARKQYEPLVAAGRAHCTEPICLKPNRWIQPGTPWDLAHHRGTGTYRGPAHRTCNRSEGATYGNKHRSRHRPTQPRQWSSRNW